MDQIRQQSFYDSDDSDSSISSEENSTEEELSSISSETDLDTDESESADGSNAAIITSISTTNANWSAICRQIPTTIFQGAQGPTDQAIIDDIESPMDYFNLIFDNDLLDLIVNETNLYASQHIARHELRPHSRARQWKETTQEELKIYFGLYMLTGIIDKKGHMSSYWTTDTRMSTPYFSQCMSRNRFQLLNKFLHFNNNDLRPSNCEDKLYKVRPVYNNIVSKWRQLYRLGEHIAIDEGMMKWRGRLGIKVYMKNKPIKYGIKSYILADSTTHYCWNMDIYHRVKKSLVDTVQNLLTDQCHNLWHSLYMDNFYSSVTMSEQLLEKKIHTVGTIRMNRGVPSEIKNLKRMKRHEVVARDNGKVMVLSWKDKRIVTAISTKHNDSAVQITRRKSGGNGENEIVFKPNVIVDYNQHMSGVDHVNQMLAYYPCTRKSLKWTKKLFFYLMCITIHNCVLYKAKSTGKLKTYYRFWQKLSFQLCGHATVETENVLMGTPGKVPRHDPPERLRGGFSAHVLVSLLTTSQEMQSRRRCRVCSRNKKRKPTSYFCQSCNIPLCRTPCYAIYHSKQKYF